MFKNLSLILAAVAVHVAFVGTSQAATIVSTDFNGRTLATTNVADDTATNLNWSTNGVADPADMVAFKADGVTGQNLFNTNAFNQNMFAPLLNTGNGNTFWFTNVYLTVLPGFNVSVTDVVFDYVAINGSGVINVPRRSDFIVTLFNPSGVAIDQVVIIDAISGSGLVPTIATVTAAFAAPNDLSAPGTYRLEITGGDIPALGTNETGNHTGIDNLSINGSVTPEPTSLALLGLGGLLIVRRRR